MTSRYSAAARLLGLALLVLAVSPVTAPFSTFDLVGLLTGSSHPASSLQSKKIVDESVSELGGHSPLADINPTWSTITSVGEQAQGVSVLLNVPLRL